jgi:hypothetical protein
VSLAPHNAAPGVTSHGPATDFKKKIDPVLTRAAAHIAGDAMVQSKADRTEPFGSAPSMEDLVHSAKLDGTELGPLEAPSGAWEVLLGDPEGLVGVLAAPCD